MSALGCRLVRLPCVAALALLCALVAAAGASALPVIPFPGTPDASPHTDIIFSALQPSQLESVRVTGSRSGAHSGRLAALPDRAGTAFIPDHGFYPGERVAVLATASSGSAGAPGSGTMHFWFRIAVSSPGSAAVPETGRAAGARPPAAASSGRTQAFHTEPDLHPPAVGVSGDPDTTSGDFFLTA